MKTRVLHDEYHEDLRGLGTHVVQSTTDRDKWQPKINRRRLESIGDGQRRVATRPRWPRPA